ncbi:hypothetical protein IGI37_000195 [Enterococcus sp. AZ194]
MKKLFKTLKVYDSSLIKVDGAEEFHSENWVGTVQHQLMLRCVLQHRVGTVQHQLILRCVLQHRVGTVQHQLMLRCVLQQ